MGILRVYLALCVVAWHADGLFPWSVQDGREAVEIFFIISGFYMAMVLSGEKYPRLRDFYLSRFLRIYPPYFVVLGVTVVSFVVMGLAFHRWHALTPFVEAPLAHDGIGGFLVGALPNLTLFGQDWLTYLAHDGGGPWRISVANNWPVCTLARYSLVRPCWSIGLELTFYVLAPFLNRLRTRFLVGLLVLSIAARLLTYHYLYLVFEPGTHRLLPFELGVFIAGMLGYRFYTKLEGRLSNRWKVRSGWQFALGAGLLLLAFHNLVTLNMTTRLFTEWYVADLISYVGWAALIPVLFFVFGDFRPDRVLGELSYPIYLVHDLLIAALIPLLAALGIGKQQLGVAAASCAVVVAAAFYKYLISPADRRRHHLTTAGPRQLSPPAKRRSRTVPPHNVGQDEWNPLHHPQA